MGKYIIFLKCSSVVVKIAAWISLFLGVMSIVTIISGSQANNLRWIGIAISLFYLFAFFFLFLIAKIADILVKIINIVQKE